MMDCTTLTLFPTTSGTSILNVISLGIEGVSISMTEIGCMARLHDISVSNSSLIAKGKVLSCLLENATLGGNLCLDTDVSV